MHAIKNRIARQPETPIVIPARVAQRAIERFVIDPHTGCHISTYSTASHGYAQVGWSSPEERRVVLAHRAAWVSAHGQIEPGMTIDHTCKNRQCVNLEHLRALDNFENGRRTSGRDWPLGQCISGHPNSDLKLYGNGEKTPRLRCQKCRVIYQQRYEQKRRAIRASAC